MQLVEKYIRKHHDYIIGVFRSMANENYLEATKVFTYIQNAFNQQNFKFLYQDSDFFAKQENSETIEKVLEDFYRQSSGEQDKKFYLYRIQFQYEEIGDILQFWMKKDSNLKVEYPGNGSLHQKQEDQKRQQFRKQGEQNKNEDDNEFEGDNQKIPQKIQLHKAAIREFEALIEQGQPSEPEENRFREQIKQLEIKIKILEQKSKIYPQDESKQQQTQNISKSMDLSEKSTSISKRVNFKELFKFYAKQLHLTGVKATFQRIQNETKSINYQKLIHFLRQYEILPKKGGDNKKLHLIYLKNCDNSRTLSFQGFMNVLIKIMEMLEPKKTQQEYRQMLEDKIISKQKKGKLLHNPFHILQKEDFRINSQDVNYNFKIVPQYGKFENQIVDTLEQRKKDKSEAKEEREEIRKQKKIKYLKKLQSFDPYNQQVLKNSKLLSNTPITEVEPIANLQNIEKFRDSSFDLKKYLGIQENPSPSPSPSPKKNRNPKGISSISEQSYKKASKLQQYEAQKMKNLMNGIIQRSNAKMQKLGISPRRNISFN